MNSLKRAKEIMVNVHLKLRGICDTKVLKAFLDTPRENFVPDALTGRAYDDCPLPIGYQQTISQPYMVAIMTEILKLTGKERVLEIGTGSGYQTAIMCKMASKVFSVERIKELSGIADKNLKKSRITNYVLRVGDGSIGWQAFAPYDRIIVTAGAPVMPKTLFSQLKEGGMIAIPVGNEVIQTLKLIEKKEGEMIESDVLDCRFVPLIGLEGWDNV